MAEEMKISNLRLHVSFRTDTDDLTDEELGRLVRYGLDYIKGEDPPRPSGRESMFVGYLRRVIDEDNERYILRCERQRENAKKRWEEKNAMACDGMPTDANDANSKSKSKSKSTIKEDREVSVRRFTPPTLSQISAYCAERKNKVDPERFYNFYASKGWMVGKNKMVDWKAAVRTWEKEDGRSSWKDWEKDFEEWLNNEEE